MTRLCRRVRDRLALLSSAVTATLRASLSDNAPEPVNHLPTQEERSGRVEEKGGERFGLMRRWPRKTKPKTRRRRGLAQTASGPLAANRSGRLLPFVSFPPAARLLRPGHFPLLPETDLSSVTFGFEGGKHSRSEERLESKENRRSGNFPTSR